MPALLRILAAVYISDVTPEGVEWALSGAGPIYLERNTDDQRDPRLSGRC